MPFVSFNCDDKLNKARTKCLFISIGIWNNVAWIVELDYQNTIVYPYHSPIRENKTNRKSY